MSEKNTGLLALLAGFLGLAGLLGSSKELNTAVNKVLNKGETFPPLPTTKPVFFGGTGTVTLDDLYKKHGNEKGVDWRLLKALAQIESSERPGAINPADPSYGLMQVLCPSNCKTCPCKNVLNVKDWSNATPEKLLDPDFNLHIASQILAYNQRTYGPLKGLALYNAWNASNRSASENGPFTNQPYVDKVLTAYAGLGGNTRTA